MQTILLPFVTLGSLINFYLDFMAQGKPAHVEIRHMEFKDALNLVQSKGGIPIVAHPGLNLMGREALASELLEQGAMGLVYGSNIYQHPSPTLITRAFMAMIHEDATVEEAWDVYQSGRGSLGDLGIRG